MIWALLLLLGVPLWLCVMGITALVLRNRALRHRPGNVSVQILRPGRTRWARGHGIWVADVFAWRGSPASWTEILVPVTSARLRPAAAAEHRPLRRLGDGPAVVELTTLEGTTFTVATTAPLQETLQGPFAGERVA
jgi:hypothetical protein